MQTFEAWAEGKLGQRYVGDTSLCAEAYAAGVEAARAEGLQLPKYLADRYDNAVEKAYSVGALKMLKNAEAEVGRWFIKQQVLLNPAAASGRQNEKRQTK